MTELNPRMSVEKRYLPGTGDKGGGWNTETGYGRHPGRSGGFSVGPLLALTLSLSLLGVFIVEKLINPIE